VKGWKKEQLTYAWNKYKGFRTGMWEIPIFTLAQKLKILKIIKKRKPVIQAPMPQRAVGGSAGVFGGSRSPVNPRGSSGNSGRFKGNSRGSSDNLGSNSKKI